MKTVPALALILLTAALAQADEPRVVVVGIDAKTQEELGPFGGSYRGIHAKLIEKLNASGAKAITFDVFFPENPDQAAGTAALAKAADASAAPVTIGIYAEEQQDGTWAKLPNAEVFKGTKVGQGSVTARRELSIREEGGELVGETRGLLVGAEAAGHRSLIETTLSRAGIADRKRLESLGLIEQVTVGWNGAPVKVPALRPNLTKKPLTLSYVDVLRKKPHPALKGAIVIVGMTDGVQDMQADPDPSKPDLKKISGVYLHAALAERVVKEVAADDAKRAKAAAGAGALGAGTRGAGLGINEALKGKLGGDAQDD
jgi:CHASE2 domain-containing sensor protein